MEQFDPYLIFRWALSMLFFGLIIYDMIVFVVWYRGLPMLAQKLVILKLLQILSTPLRIECFLILFLLAVETWLVLLIMGWSV